MRWAIVFAVALAGCGGSDGSDSPDNEDMGSSSPGDMAKAASACDPIKQDCGSGKKCVPKFLDKDMTKVGTTCVADGTVASGATCVQDTKDTSIVTDDCAAGATCDNDGPKNAWACRKFCAADKDCATGEKCGDVLGAGTWGWCLPTCTAFGTDCPTGDSCSVGLTAINGTDEFFVCKTPGDAKVFEKCDLDTDCGANLVCDGDKGYCTPICDATHMCTDQPPGDMGKISCMAYTGITGGGGICTM